jgi:hypothetical protein
MKLSNIKVNENPFNSSRVVTAYRRMDGITERGFNRLVARMRTRLKGKRKKTRN